MLRKFFFIVLILLLNLFDIAKSEGSQIYSSKLDTPKITSNNNLPEPLHLKVEEELDIDQMLMANAVTGATLAIFSPLLSKSKEGGIWLRPYAAFENIPLKNGPTVNSISYGSLLGYDTSLKDLKNRWQVKHTGYVGYTGSKQSYNSVKQDQLSGFAGAYSTFYKDDFFFAAVLTSGANVAKPSDGKDITSVNAGFITRTGYNWRFPHRFVFQPNYIMSYTFDYTFDSQNGKGETIEEGPLGIIYIIPSARFYLDLNDGWKPFIVVNMHYNIVTNGQVKVNNVAQPMVSVKPFIQYGGGVQKGWEDKYFAFIQVLVKNGGRNGVGFLANFKWVLDN